MPQPLLTSLRRRARHWAGLWLIALVAGLPLAQAVAAVHSLSHATQAFADDSSEGPGQTHLAGCEQCLAAHALADAAPQPMSIDWQAASPPQPVDSLSCAYSPALEPRLGFRSRAPPSSL